MSEKVTATERFLVWNGSVQPVDSVSIDPRGEGWLYGYGCFETMGLKNGSIRYFDEHWARLCRTAGEMSMQVPFGRAEAEAGIESLTRANGFRDGVARLSLHSSGGRVEWMLRVFAGMPKPKGGFSVGLSRFSHPGGSPLSRWKHNNYLLNILAYREGKAEGWDETLLCNQGEVVEGAFSNVWILKGGELQTPPLSSGALPGIVRERILRVAPAKGLPVREAAIRLEDMPSAEGVFLSNAGMGFREVVRLADRSFPPQPEWLKSIGELLE